MAVSSCYRVFVMLSRFRSRMAVSLLDVLSSASERKAPLSEEKIFNYFVQCCLALRYMHTEKRVVHRDLTPANIMIDKSGKVKIGALWLYLEQLR